MPSKPTTVSEVEWAEHEKTFGVKKVLAYGTDGSNAVALKVNSDGSLVTDSKECTDFEGSPVTVGTTAVELTFTGTTQAIKISSANTNTGTIYIGKANVTSAGANAMDDLVAGQSLELELNDASNAIYAVASVAGQTVYKMALL